MWPESKQYIFWEQMFSLHHRIKDLAAWVKKLYWGSSTCSSIWTYLLLCARRCWWTLWCRRDISWGLPCTLSGHCQVHTCMPAHNLLSKPTIHKHTSWYMHTAMHRPRTRSHLTIYIRIQTHLQCFPKYNYIFKMQTSCNIDRDRRGTCLAYLSTKTESMGSRWCHPFRL